MGSADSTPQSEPGGAAPGAATMWECYFCMNGRFDLAARRAFSDLHRQDHRRSRCMERTRILLPTSADALTRPTAYSPVPEEIDDLSGDRSRRNAGSCGYGV